MRHILQILHSKPLIIYALVLLSAALLLFIPNDPDFFWHLKYGELTFSQGPISHDPFSYTFSDFTFYDYQWGSHLIIYALYTIGGFFGPAIFYAAVVIATLLITTRIALTKLPPKHIRIIVFFTGLLLMSPIIGIRPQTVTILGLAILYCIANAFLQNRRKLIFALPAVMLIWANLHPGFLSGLIFLATILGAELLKITLKFVFSVFEKQSPFQHTVTLQKQEILTLLIVTISSILVTLATPFTYNILKQSAVFSLDQYAQQVIREWLAPNFHLLSGQIAIFSIFFVALTFLRRRKVDLTEIMILLVFGLMSLNTIRHFALFVTVAIPSILAIPDLRKIPKLDIKDTTILIVKVLIVIASFLMLVLSLIRFFVINASEKQVYEYVKYPYEAVEHIRKNNLPGPILNTYKFGGFLIWEFPEEKTFIDGRMTSWELGGTRILREYSEIYKLSQPDWLDRLNSYGVNLLLVEKEAPIGNALREHPDWELVYEDEIAMIVVRKKS